MLINPCGRKLLSSLIVITKLDVDKQGAVPKSQKNDASTVHVNLVVN